MENLFLGIPVNIVVLLIPGLPLLGAFLNGAIALVCRNGRHLVPKALVNLIGIGMPLLSFVGVCGLHLLGTDPIGFTTAPLWDWMRVGDLTVALSFKVDRLSLLMGLVITGVGTLIHIYSIGYMAHDKGYARYFAFLNLFLFSMLVLVLASNLPLLFLGWEGVGLCSYFLIGFWFDDPAKAAAGKKAFLVNRIGDAGFLLGIFLLYRYLSSHGIPSDGGLLSFDVLEKYQGDLRPVATAAALLLFVGAVGKSAQIPLYVWLPDAMAGPTPVSALIHAATMVTAGVYLIARLHFLYVLSPVAMQVVATVGMATAFFAATIALVQSDIKKVLAYSTISQLGTMVFGVGVGAFSAGLFHLTTHAFFKACLFLGAGSVIHGMGGEQNIWKMGGLKNRMPITCWTFALAVAAIAGLFPFAGFFSKDAILWQGFAMGHPILWAVGFVTAGMTSFYMCRLFALVFLGRPRGGEHSYHAHESPWTMTVPLILLALLSLAGGWVGVPEAMGGKDHWFRWFTPFFLHPSFLERLEAAGHGKELILSVATLVWIFNLGLFAILLYGQQPAFQKVKRMAASLSGIHRLLSGKFYVDEIYQTFVVRPMMALARWTWKFMDEKVIDSLLVEGTAQSVGLLGRTVTLIHSGAVQTYLLVFALGAVACIAYFSL